MVAFCKEDEDVRLNEDQTATSLRTFELMLRPSVAAPCCRGDAEPDLG